MDDDLRTRVQGHIIWNAFVEVGIMGMISACLSDTRLWVWVLALQMKNKPIIRMVCSEEFVYSGDERNLV